MIVRYLSTQVISYFLSQSSPANIIVHSWSWLTKWFTVNSPYCQFAQVTNLPQSVTSVTSQTFGGLLGTQLNSSNWPLQKFR